MAYRKTFSYPRSALVLFTPAYMYVNCCRSFRFGSATKTHFLFSVRFQWAHDHKSCLEKVNGCQLIITCVVLVAPRTLGTDELSDFIASLACLLPLKVNQYYAISYVELCICVVPTPSHQPRCLTCYLSYGRSIDNALLQAGCCSNAYVLSACGTLPYVVPIFTQISRERYECEYYICR